MNKSDAWYSKRPSMTSIVAGSIIIISAVFSSFSWAFFAIAALGIFGPGILRELGLLKDKDEFQQRAAHRAGYHAFLVSGVTALCLVAFIRSGDLVMKDPEELATLFLSLLWFTWLFSTLLAYWGPQKTASRILIVFGIFWLLFNVFGNLHSLVGLLMQVLVTTSPFFILAYLARRLPRITGILLLLVSTVIFILLDLHENFPTVLVDKFGVVILFMGPMAASGFVLLRAGKTDGRMEEGE